MKLELSSILIGFLFIYCLVDIGATSSYANEPVYILTGTTFNDDNGLIEQFFLIKNSNAASQLLNRHMSAESGIGDPRLMGRFPISILDSDLEPIVSFLYYPSGNFKGISTKHGMYFEAKIRRENGKYFISLPEEMVFKDGRIIEESISSVTTFDYLIRELLK